MTKLNGIRDFFFLKNSKQDFKKSLKHFFINFLTVFMALLRKDLQVHLKLTLQLIWEVFLLRMPQVKVN